MSPHRLARAALVVDALSRAVGASRSVGHRVEV
jgi:hypothetical protein